MAGGIDIYARRIAQRAILLTSKRESAKERATLLRRTNERRKEGTWQAREPFFHATRVVLQERSNASQRTSTLHDRREGDVHLDGKEAARREARH